MEEKLKNLERIEKRVTKLQKKGYKLIAELNSTDEYNMSVSATDYAERDLLSCIKWIHWEINRQREHVLKEEDK